MSSIIGSQQLLQAPMAERPVALKNGRATVPITQYLDGLNFEPETERVMGVAFELVCATLRLTDVDKKIKPVIARKILELATFGERDPNELCDGTLNYLHSNGTLNYLHSRRRANDRKKGRGPSATAKPLSWPKPQPV